MPFKVVFCIPTRDKPSAPTIASLEASLPLVEAAGYDHALTHETGNPYISGARANCLKRAINGKGDIFIFIDDDVSWRPEDMLKLIQTEGEVVSGTYRTKEDDPNYMGHILQDKKTGRPISMREDGCFECACVPAGFLKVTKEAVAKFMHGYPNLCYGPPWDQAVDLFNHGAHKGLWFGEDYAFCRNWRDIGGKVWLIPDMEIYHHDWKTGDIYKGNFHQYMLRQPGGKLEGVPYDKPGYDKPVPKEH